MERALRLSFNLQLQHVLGFVADLERAGPIPRIKEFFFNFLKNLFIFN